MEKRKTRQMKGTKKFVQALQLLLLMESPNVRPEALTFFSGLVERNASFKLKGAKYDFPTFEPAIGTLPHWGRHLPAFEILQPQCLNCLRKKCLIQDDAVNLLAVQR